MIERIADVLTGLRNDSVGRSTSGEGTASRNVSARLFRCACCETVYVAEEKRTCASCDVEVTQIRSTVRSRPTR
ncbi:hypothetical protein [Haloplanus pelagicus]|jgi:rRNA maturation endonuclease Nob1|uniref:hypothetical protein n=1 Tax=Haloplanus pelagicus TaxID=2949995 RepID=UPI002041B5C9|nr:hypothetical protein [Haloplanus sp. HW8-1]